MPLDQAEAKRLMDAMLGKNGAYVAPTTPMRAALTTTAPTAASPGTEVVNSGGSTYARQDISAATPASSTNGAITNSVSAVTYTNMPVATVVGVDVYDSNASPRRAMCGSLSAPKTTAAGDSLSFAIGALSLTMA